MFKNCFKTYSSMEKVMIDKMPVSEELKSASILKNERFSFQIAYEYVPGVQKRKYPVSFEIKSELKNYITVGVVEHVPGEMMLYPGCKDDAVISDKPGLYPDIIMPMDENVIYPHEGMCDSLWFTLDTNGAADAGIYDISVEFKYEKKAEKDGEEDVLHTVVKTVRLEIIDVYLPEQGLKYTQWFHADCLASYYKLDMFCEKHWEIIENFMRVAVKNGHNVIFTPVFTPPLDTQVGGERPTTQLLDIFLDNGKYTFGFDKLDRWIELAQKVGYKYFEMPHLFTQWGAEFCPKIMATVDGNYKKIFGWETKSTSPEYREFLASYLPAITAYMEQKGLKDYTFFHYSDEPNEKHVESYKEATASAKPYLEGWTVMDALSHYEYYEQGLIKNVIPSIRLSARFVEEKVPNLWMYYCCGHDDYYTNRFLCFPLWRTRIAGIQFFKYDIKGFLQWGYNFYYSQFSKKLINPYHTTDAGRAFPAGDAFSVYPGDDGKCLESIRLVSFNEGVQDMRALELLAGLIGREKTVALIDDVAGMDVKFNEYPANAYFIQTLRRKVNELIKENVKQR